MRSARSAIAALVCALPWSTAPVRAEGLSRAEAVARALEANPEVRKSLEDVAFLQGLVVEARADALPDLKVFAFASRYRDPALLNSRAFDAFPPDLDGLRPEAVRAWLTARRRRKATSTAAEGATGEAPVPGLPGAAP